MHEPTKMSFPLLFPDTVFVSSGGNTEPDQRSDISQYDILGKVFKGIEIWVLKDRDIASGKPLDAAGRQTYLDNSESHHRVLKRWELETISLTKRFIEVL